MLTATFYRQSSQYEGRVAQSEVRKAGESLRGLLLHKGGHSKEAVGRIDEATKRLQRLRWRIEKHAQLMEGVWDKERRMAEEKECSRRRMDGVEKGIAAANLETVKLLAQRDEICRDIALSRRSLELHEHRNNQEEWSEGEEYRITSVRIETLCEGDWDVGVDGEDESEGDDEEVKHG